MAHLNDDGIIVNDYNAWLEATDLEDSEETRGWYDCPEGEESDYIDNHQDWWDNL
ncbi:MAG: hypothetical protein NC416_18870 [Eubacterium sp.]|nr:hypothetical protein [Eubacterium sp.]